MDPTTSALGSTALKAGVSTALQSILKNSSQRLGTKLGYWSAKAAIPEAANRVDRVRMVKTIWQIDKAVDLVDFYYPAKVTVGGNARTVRELDDIATHGNLLLRGTVGQGKSILLRYLTIIEAVDGHRLPLFVELRRLQKEESLEEHLIAELETLGLACDHETLDWLIHSGLVMLFFDAFDEVGEERRRLLVNEVEKLCRTHEKLRMVITSRPDCGLEGSVCFRSFDLAPLTPADHASMLNRICDERTMAAAIMKGLDDEGTDIRSLLTTPLMLALLVLHYRAVQAIPATVIAFFSDLFLLLLQRHDKTKPGYTRPRASSASDLELERIFATICFLTRKQGASSFSSQAMYDLVSIAMKQQDWAGHPELVLKDISTISCLILQEGGEYRFIHKSVQEFYAARFVSLQNDGFADKFYGAMMSHWQGWKQELMFLQQIDAYRCTTLFSQKKYEEELGPLGGTAGAVRRALNDLRMSLSDGKPRVLIRTQWWAQFCWPEVVVMMRGINERLESDLVPVMEKTELLPVSFQELSERNGDFMRFYEITCRKLTALVIANREALQRAVDVAKSRTTLLDDL